MELEQELESVRQVYGKMADAYSALYALLERKMAVKAALERKVDAALLAGDIAGKNEREREAAMRTMFAQDYEELSRLEMDINQATNTKNVAEFAVDAQEMRVRLFEVAAKVSHAREK